MTTIKNIYEIYTKGKEKVIKMFQYKKKQPGTNKGNTEGNEEYKGHKTDKTNNNRAIVNPFLSIIALYVVSISSLMDK